MSLLDDTVLFATIVQQGGFSRAAKQLGLSNGLVSRRLTHLENELGVSLLKRTTRQIHLTPEGEMLLQHAQRIQQEMDTARCLIQSLSEKPKGHIRVSAPSYFGRYYLMPILIKFMQTFDNIKIDIIIADQFIDPVKNNIDLLIRGIGYFDKAFSNSSLRTKFLLKRKIALYASMAYLIEHGQPEHPDDLLKHHIIGFTNTPSSSGHETWHYDYAGKESNITLQPKFNCNDLDSRLLACRAGQGIAKFTDLIFQDGNDNNQLKPVLSQYNWGEFSLHAVYAQQQSLPQRTRLLLDFIVANIQNFSDTRLS